MSLGDNRAAEIRIATQSIQAIILNHVMALHSGFRWATYAGFQYNERNVRFELSIRIVMKESAEGTEFEFTKQYEVAYDDLGYDSVVLGKTMVICKEDMNAWFQDWLQSRLVPA